MCVLCVTTVSFSIMGSLQTLVESPHLLAAVLASTLLTSSYGVTAPAVLPTGSLTQFTIFLRYQFLVPVLTLVRFGTVGFIACASLGTSSMTLT